MNSRDDARTQAPDPTAGQVAGFPSEPPSEPPANPWAPPPAGGRIDPATGEVVAPRGGFGLNRHLAIAMVCATLVVALLAVIQLLPVRLAVLTPGPVYDTLGEVDGHPLIQVSGHSTYPATGQLNLTTVSVYGGPGERVDLWRAIKGWLDPADTVLPVDQVFPPGTTEEQEQQQNEADMVNSQQSATAAALRELGIDYTTTVTVQDSVPDTPAASVFKKGDVVLAVDGRPVRDFDALRDELQKTEPGEDVTVTVRRGGDRQDLTVRTLEGEDGTTRLGVIVESTFDFPFDVDIKIDNVGGPSAGTMFALGIIDTLTPGSMTGGKKIAGTGTIDPDGTVGPIGGIVQKVNGARDSGVEYFLVPEQNCDEVRGHVPDGLATVRVSTLDEARTAVETIGAGKPLSGLPSCN